MAEIKQQFNNVRILDIEELPQIIRDWLGSNLLTYAIININKRLGFKNWKRAVIPDVVFNLVSRKLAPEELVNELSQRLEISFSSAKILAEEMVEKMLKPIQQPLKNLGISLDEIFTAITEPAPLLLQEEEPGIIAPSPETTTEKAEPQIFQEQQKIFPPKPEVSETKKIDIAKIETPFLKKVEAQPFKSAQTTNGPEPHIIYKEIKTFKVPITISEQKIATINNAPKSSEAASELAPKIAKENLAAVPPISPQQTERVSLQQLLESKKNNIVSSRYDSNNKNIENVLGQATRSNIAKPSVSAGPLRQSASEASRPAAPVVPPRPALREEMNKQESRRIPIKPEQKLATMLPKNFQQKTADLQSKPQGKLTNVSSRQARTVNARSARVVHYSDLRTPLNNV